MRPFKLFAIPILILALVFMALHYPTKKKIIYCYGKFKPELVKGYDLVVVESAHFLPSSIRVLKSNNEKVVAYISLGEVNRYAQHYPVLKDCTLGKNEIWDSYYLDIRATKTQTVLLQLMQKVFNDGYDGMFLDNFDNYNQWGPQKTQKKDFIAFVNRIRLQFPSKYFIQNAGIELVPETYKLMDALAIESVVTDYDFKAQKYQLRTTQNYREYRKEIEDLVKNYPIATHFIEYADQSPLVETIKKELDDSQFDYFIGTISLQKLPQTP